MWYGMARGWRVTEKHESRCICCKLVEQQAALVKELLETLKLAYKLPHPWMPASITWPEWDAVMMKIEAAIARAERKGEDSPGSGTHA